MPWKCLPEFSIHGTNVPIEWLQRVRFDQSYDAIVKWLEAEATLLEEAKSIQREMKAFVESSDSADLKKLYWKIGSKLWSSIEKGKLDDVHRHLSNFLQQCASETIRELVHQWGEKKNSHVQNEQLTREIFLKELAEKRGALWNFLHDDLFQEGLFHLNPDLIDQLLPYTALWSDRSRDKKMRKRERTLVSYLSRLCAKSSAAGPLGPSFGGSLESKKSPSVQFQWEASAKDANGIGRREVFMSYWAAQALAGKIAENDPLRLALPLSLHPAVFIQDKKLIRAIQIPDHSFLPKNAEISPSPEILDWVSSLNGGKKTIPTNLKEKFREEFLTLLKERFILDDLLIPPGTLHPLQYLQDLLKKADAGSEGRQKWADRLAQFEEFRNQFKTGDLDAKKTALKSSEALFIEITGDLGSRGEGSYYADRFIFFEDCARACKPLRLGGEITKEILESYTFSLELLAPLWFYAALSSLLTARHYFETTSPESAVMRIVDYFGREFQSNSVRLTEELKEDPRALEWLEGISKLIRLSREHLGGVDASQKEVVLSHKETWVKKYRKILYDLIADSEFPLPLFASGPGLHLASSPKGNISDGDFLLVADSVIFGTSMHFTILNYFATDLNQQMQKTEEILLKLMGVENCRWANFIPYSEQMSKFTPWLGPGVDIELLGTSSKKDPLHVSVRDISFTGNAQTPISTEIEGKRTSLVPGFLNMVRLDKKLTFENFEGHFPRIRMGRAVLQRENWKLKGASLVPAAKEVDDFDLFVHILREKRKSGFPDWIFADPEGPKKNIMIDFKNYFLIEVLAHLARECESLRISEMLPSPEELWMKSPDGKHHYNAEMMPFLYYDPKD